MGKAATRAKNKYNAENYERIALNVPKGQKDAIKAHADNRGESLNGFLNRAISETMERDNADDHGDPELKTVDGKFYEGNFVTVSIGGDVVKRRVYYSASAGDLYIRYKNKAYFLYEFDKE